MKKFIYSFLVSLIPATLFPIAFITCVNNFILGMFIYIIAFISLDLYSYIDKKFNYPYNLFIKS